MAALPVTRRWSRLLSPSFRFRGVSDSALIQARRVESIQPQHERVRLDDQQKLISRLLAMKSQRSKASFESLPRLFEAPNLLDNPRLASYVSPIDPRLLASFYNELESNNSRLTFFNTGNVQNSWSGHYLRSFIPHAQSSSSASHDLRDVNGLPWQPLANLLQELFSFVGESGFRDFYTHVLPANVGRHLPHRDKLQSDTWKVDIRMSPSWTELLVLDEEDGRWYALRFPPGCSGFVIDSVLFTRFHGVRAGPAIQQSILAVFNKQGSTRDTVRAALARKTEGLPPLPDHVPVGPFHDFALPSAPTSNPRSQEVKRVGAQSTKHNKMCLELLRNAVRVVAPDIDQHQQEGAKLVLGRVRRAVIDQAIATLPSDVRGDVRKTYERNCKLVQLPHYGTRLSSQAQKRANVESGKARRIVVDDRLLSIRGTATVENCAFHFPDFDGTKATLLRFSWAGIGDRFRVTVSPDSTIVGTKSLALLAQKLRWPRKSSNAFQVNLDFNGDVCTGKTAELLRGYGLTLQVVRMPGEPDYKTKRSLELERRTRSKPLFQKTRLHPDHPKAPLSPWHFYLRDQLKLTKKAFDQLSQQERQGYQNKADADRKRYQTQLSERRLTDPNVEPPPKRQRSIRAYQYFVQDQPKEGVKDSKTLKQLFRQLDPQAQQIYLAKAASDRRRQRADHYQQMSRWRVAHPHYQRPPKRPVPSWHYFVQDRMKVLQASFDQLSLKDQQVYLDSAEADRRRYQTQLSEWELAHPNAATALTAYQVFCAETRPSLLQQHPDKYMGSDGQTTLNRDLSSQWQRLGTSGWVEYEWKARPLEEKPRIQQQQ